MQSGLQNFFLRIYRTASSSGVLSTAWGRACFEWAYLRYKFWFEVGDLTALRSLVRPGSWIIDVGANVGFFTLHFAQWVQDGGRVVAIEPEDANFQSLKRRLDRAGLKERVDLVQAVAAESAGMLRLEISPAHPADHKISGEGLEVKSVSIDDLLEDHGWPKVSLVKIDVQGAEERVLRGMSRTIERFHPALLVEVDDGALRRMGSSGEELFRRLREHGYRFHALRKGSISNPISPAEALNQCGRRGYADFLCLGAADLRGPSD